MREIMCPVTGEVCRALICRQASKSHCDSVAVALVRSTVNLATNPNYSPQRRKEILIVSKKGLADLFGFNRDQEKLWDVWIAARLEKYAGPFADSLNGE